MKIRRRWPGPRRPIGQPHRQGLWRGAGLPRGSIRAGRIGLEFGCREFGERAGLFFGGSKCGYPGTQIFLQASKNKTLVDVIPANPKPLLAIILEGLMGGAVKPLVAQYLQTGIPNLRKLTNSTDCDTTEADS